MVREISKSAYDSVETVVNDLTKKLNLDANESEMLEHDLNNLRGDEWIDEIQKCDIATINNYLEFIYSY